MHAYRQNLECVNVERNSWAGVNGLMAVSTKLRVKPLVDQLLKDLGIQKRRCFWEK
jgi:hypothetical protein